MGPQISDIGLTWLSFLEMFYFMMLFIRYVNSVIIILIPVSKITVKSCCNRNLYMCDHL